MAAVLHPRSRKLLILVAVLPFALALLNPAAATAAGPDQPAPAPSSAEQEPDPEPTPPQPPEEPDPTDEPTTPVEEPTPTDEPTVPAEELTIPAEEPTTESTEAPDPVEPEPEVDPGETTVQQAVADPPPKVTICHRTNDPTNPYNQITVSFPQAEGHANQHTGPIFTPDGPRPWGDIIPPNPAVPNGKNWPEGRPILNDGCEVTPHPGPLPSATIGEVECIGTVPSLDVTVSNDADATAPAFFTIVVDGDLVQTVGPVAPGASETVTLTAAGLAAREDQTFTVEVRSGGRVIAAEVVTVDCDPPPPDVDLVAQLDCLAGAAIGTLQATNNGQAPVTVTVTVNGAVRQPPLVVGPGATETTSADFSQFEDQTITIQILVDGQPVATYTPTPDCDQTAVPRVSVAGLECPPPSATATLANVGDPESTVVFTILVNGQVAQQSAPLFGGDITTIVGDLTQFEDQTITIELRANGEVLGSRTLAVDCKQPTPGPGPDARPNAGQIPAAGVLPDTGAPFGLGLLVAALGLVAAGSVLVARARARD